MTKKNQGFTLIELLIVISIIGILSALLLANFQDARARARDTERKNDLKQMKTALRLYYNDHQSYPDDDDSGNIAAACGSAGDTDCVWGTSLFGTSDTPYMSVLPQDPMGDTRPYYYVQEDSGEGFSLYACIENKSDNNGEACADTICSDEWCFKLTED